MILNTAPPPPSSRELYLPSSNQPKINVERNMLGRTAWHIMNKKIFKKSSVLEDWGTRCRVPVSSKESGKPWPSTSPPLILNYHQC